MSLPGTHPMSAMRNPNHPFHTGKPPSDELLAAEREEPPAGLLLGFCLCAFSGASFGLGAGLLIGWAL